MVRCLSEKDKITLTSSGKQTEFFIDEVVGVGGSCIAYKVSYTENEDIMHKGILKEFYPAFLINNNTITRSDATISVPLEYAERFNNELVNFKSTYRVINEYLANNLSASNYHTVQMGLYTGNNTAYTLTSCDYGMSYDKTTDDDAYSLFKIILSVTKAVELYHHAGFLHLDIKPKNILILDGVTDIVKLFDFDSLIPLKSFTERTVNSVPIPGEYYVPELNNCEIRNIGIHTDIFEIGAMLFNRLFGRYPEPADMRYDSTYPFDESDLLAKISPQAAYEIESLLKNTIQISKRNRYQTTTELKAQIKKIISLIGTDVPYLIDLPRWQPTTNFIGRTSDISLIEKHLQNDGYVFIKGVGGLGKSELVKYYLKRNYGKYHTVQFYKYDSNLKSLVASLTINGVNDHEFTNFDELVHHKNKILHTCDEHTLIVVDNFNVTHDKFLREFLPSNNSSFKVIFTTRCNLAADYYLDKVITLPKLSMEECKKLFISHAECEPDDSVEAIIDMVDYNTLVLILLAETMRKSKKTSIEILALLCNQELEQEQTMIFHEYDYPEEEIEEYNKINSHLNVIFDISKMSDIEKVILKNMTLVSQSGITIEDFMLYCDTDDFTVDVISEIVDLGWIERRDCLIFLHPIISDILSINSEIVPNGSYYNLADNLEELCNPDYTSHISVVMNKVSIALHLKRRYKDADIERKIIIRAKLGRLYANIYNPKQARESLLEAINLANEYGKTEFLPYIYSFAGEVEKDFGTISEAIQFYEKAIFEGKKPENEYCEIVLESIMDIGACLAENGDLISANISYDEALYFAQLHSLDTYIYSIAQELVVISEQLELYDEVKKYKLIMSEYEKYSKQQIYISDEVSEMANFAKDGDFISGMETYEKFLEEKRNELGEDSPIYQDIARNRWVFYAVNNDFEQAKRLVAQNLSFIEDKFGAVSMEMADQLTTIAQIFPKFQEFDYAIASAKRAIAICDNLGQHKTKIALNAKLTLAKCYLILGKIDSAKQAYSDVDFSAFSGTEILSEIVTTAGQVLCELSEYDVVEQMCTDVFRRKNVDKFSLAQTYLLNAIVKEQKGELDDAENMCELSKPILESIVDETLKREWLIQYYRTIAHVAFRKGEYEKAIDKINELISKFPEDKRKDYLLIHPLLERGLYYALNQECALAIKDYSLCEEILTENNMPGESFIILYNNISVNLCNSKDFDNAEKYLNKIIAIKPTVVEPTSYTDALICSNIGWIALNKGDVMKAGSMFNRAAKAYKAIGATKSADYLTTLNNLAQAYESRKMYDKAQKIYQIIFSLYDDTRMDASGRFRMLISCCHLRILLANHKADTAIQFINSEDNYIEHRFGTNSILRIDFLLQAGVQLKTHGIDLCMKLYSTAKDAIDNGGHLDTIYNAKLLDYVGVCYTDFYEDHEFAIELFNKSKALFEKLGLENDELYPVVISNIKYAQDKHMDQLLQQLANAIVDENNED